MKLRFGYGVTMSKTIKSTAAVYAFVTVAVIFFLAIVLLVVLVPDDPYGELVPDDGMVFEYMEVNVVWKKDRSCKIEYKTEARFNESGHGIYVDIPVNSGERIRNLSLTAKTGNGRVLPYRLEHESGFSIVRAVVGDEDRLISRGNTLVCEWSYDYITPVHPDGADILDINAIGYGWTSDIKKAVVSVTYPAKPQAASGFGVYVGDDKFTDVSVSADGLTYTVNVGRLNAFENVRVKHKMPKGTLKSYTSAEPIATITVGVAILAAAILLMLFVGKDKPLSPVVDFYPPRVDGDDGRKRYMLPVQMGKIIDGTCSDDDVTSLIFYWASEGYIEIEEKNGETYFKRLRKLDAVTSYEKNLFDKMFSYSTNDDDGVPVVSMSALTGKLYSAVSQTKAELNARYKGKLYKTPYTVLAVAFGVICALFGVLTAVLCTLRVGALFFNPAGVIVLLPVAVAAGFGTVLMLNYQKLSATKQKLFLALLFAATVLLAVGVMLLIPTHAMSWVEKFVFAACLGSSSALAPFLTKRTSFYTEQLNDIVGFRNFLRDAEKDRLETLLKDDPQYYYNILPYANVLGVSDIWADKFKGLAVEPPTYYRGGNISLFDVIIINRLMRSVGRTISYTPPKASGRSFSGGGHSGGHGGGFGGFGGGGGGRW